VLAELIKRQGALSDAEFSQLLGVPRSTWYNTRKNILLLGPRIVRASLRVWPDLAPMALEWLAGHSQDENGEVQE
jgi:hypothetical protein